MRQTWVVESASAEEKNDAMLPRTEYTLRAEVAGGLGPQSVLDSSTNPPVVSVLHYDFVSWLGDDIVASFPCSIVTSVLRVSKGEAVRRALVVLARQMTR